MLDMFAVNARISWRNLSASRFADGPRRSTPVAEPEAATPALRSAAAPCASCAGWPTTSTRPALRPAVLSAPSAM